LVIIDGVAGSINDIDANEIESVSILKDAASAAIYGSRAANGVILITTKRAEGKGKISVNYKGYVGKQMPTAIPKVTNGLTYMRVYNEANMNDYGTEVYSEKEMEDFQKKYNEDPDNYDWQKAILKGSGFMQSHFISLNVNNGILHVTPSLSYVDQEGLIKNTDFKRYIFRNNMDITPGDKISISLDVAVTNKDRKQIAHEGDIWNYLGRMPTNIPIRYGDQWSDGWVKINPVGLIDDGGSFKTNDLEFRGKLSLNYKPVEWLSFTGMVAPRYLTHNTHDFTRSVMTYLEDGSEAGEAYTYSDLTESAYRSLYGTFQFLANAHKNFNGHHLSLMVGTSRETFDEKYLSGYRRDYVYPNYEQLGAGADNDTKNNNGTESQWLLVSGFGRFMYNFREKYLFEANLRYDGSSRFLGDNRWAAFPSFSAGWIISKEPFMKDLSPVLSFLKLRGSWGKLGNQNIGSSYYPFSEPLSIGSISMGGIIYPEVSQTRLSNPDLHWESTTMAGIGVDANLFNNLSLSFDWYSKRTDGILLLLNVSELIGLAPPYQNAGKVSNKGWEFSAQYHKDWGDFHLGVGFNLSDVKNKIIDMKGQTFGSLLRQQEGYPINSIYGYVSDGLYQSQDEINKGPGQIGTLQPGDIKYVDMNGDNKITDSDKVIIGNTIPRYTYSGNINLGWKGFSLGLFLQGVGKVDGYLNAQYVIPLSNSSSVKPWQLDYWSEDNKNAKLPRVSITSANNVQNSTFWMRSAAYLRLKNIQLGYHIPQVFVKKVGLQSAFVYINGQNVFTQTNFYQGYDPEINYDASSSDGVTLGKGGFYPQVKTFTFGVDLKF
jgi:TonB-linked SusC/RagA family outer membrane protein